jgi:glycosyltransferase involved in cell wall biosynthesis
LGIRRGVRAYRKAIEIFRIGGGKYLLKRLLNSIHFRINRRRLSALIADTSPVNPEYPENLNQFRLYEQLRLRRYQANEFSVYFSVLTTLYEGTSAPYFKKLSDSVLGQVYNNFEWIILAHGPIASELRSMVETLRQDSRVRITYLPENLGIIRAMELCLKKSEGDYIIPIDSDDLLALDALLVLSTVIMCEKFPAFVYSDEDHLRENILFAPYERPDWDPLLNLNSSYIWHLCAFSRKKALEIGVYSDDRMNWCHDWDTVTRFWLAKEKIYHVPEVLYHWRQHEQSTTNKIGEHRGSLESQKQLLEMIVARSPAPEQFKVVESPVWRGAKEWWIKRKMESGFSVKPVTIHRVQSGMISELTKPVNYPSNAITEASDLVNLVRHTEVDYLCFIDSYVEVDDCNWFEDLLKYFQLVPNVLSISGRVLDPSGKVSCGGELIHSSSYISDPMKGALAETAGPFAFALKVRRVDILNLYFSVTKVKFLRQLLEDWSGGESLDELAVYVGLKAHQFDLIIGHDPSQTALRTLFVVNPIMSPHFQKLVRSEWGGELLKKPFHGPFKNCLSL